MTHSYILFSVGPVQSAISQARRTQDLFIGSRVLSLLVWAGLNVAQERSSIVYPAFGADNHNLPNRFLIHCETERINELKRDVSEAIRKGWLYITGETRRTFDTRFARRSEKELDVTIDTEIWRRQVNHWLEIYCVDVPDTGNYAEDNQKANRLLAARKLVRDFQAIEEPGDKCSITGEHEALHHKGSGKAKRSDVNAYWDTVRKRQRNLALLSKGERLCALSVVKRFAHEAVVELSPEGRFPSTSSIASAPFRAVILRNWDDLQDYIGQYLTALEDVFEKVFGQDREAPYFHRRSENGETLHPEYFPYLDNIRSEDTDRTLLKFRSLDGDFLYKEGLQPAALQEYAGADQPPAPQEIKDVQDKLQELYKAAEQLKIQPPSNYLALLSMDGDKMGEQAKRFSEADDHTKFSQRLADFARDEVVRIVEIEAPGRLVYAGGDDVLALLPAEYALSTAEKLRIEFADKFQPEGLHVSTGIAFVHRTHSLQAAVVAAKTAQERAKKEFGRNAVSAALLQRSGEPLNMGVRWDVVSGEIDGDTQQPKSYSAMKVVEAIAGAMAGNIVSRSLPYDVEHIVYAFARDNAAPEPRKKEFERVYRRRYQPDDYETSNAGVLLCQAVIAIGEYGVLDYHLRPDPVVGWENLMGWLRLARFLAGEEVQRVAVP